LSQRLKAKGFPAFVVAPKTSDGLYNVRVGAFTTRADAERVQARLRQQEKSNPFIVKQ
jgi:cell division septation protein DedD